uniref:Uncharacterized protein n=1 Tax=Rhizophora mucronata TaxID=61149 RepID=A0A2P2JMV0_RHIMU
MVCLMLYVDCLHVNCLYEWSFAWHQLHLKELQALKLLQDFVSAMMTQLPCEGFFFLHLCLPYLNELL